METHDSIASSFEECEDKRVVKVRTSEAGDFVAPDDVIAGDLVPYERVPAKGDGNCFFSPY
jgi:hypothetical protein